MLTGFRHCYVFDVSQTDGEPLPELCPELKGDSKSMREFYAAAKTICPFPVSEERIEGGAKGYFNHITKSIGIKDNMAYKHKAKTLIHELAHGMLHGYENPRRDELTRNDREIEAEGTAFVVLNYFGFDTSDYSFPYVAHWNPENSLDAIQKAGDIIQKTSQEIIEMIETQLNQEAA